MTGNIQSGTGNSGQRYIDQFDVLLLDMGLTFMFDCDRFGTEDDLAGTYKRMGGRKLDDQDVNRILSAAFEQMVADGKIPGNYEKIQTVSGYLKRQALAASLPRHELELLERVFAEHEIGTIPDKYIDIIKQLSTTHRLGIISDIWSRSGRFYRELEKMSIRDTFEVIIFSSDVGIIKPSPKIFSKAMEALDTDISKVVYIGDSMRRDIAGAKNFGMSAVWIGNEHLVAGNLLAQPDHIISDLRDLL